nr:MAG TPA: hypothetical protein [Caudoviricetes sp.]
MGRLWWLSRESPGFIRGECQTKMEDYGVKGSFWKMENTDRILRQALKERVMQLSEVEIEEVIKAIENGKVSPRRTTLISAFSCSPKNRCTAPSSQAPPRCNRQ